MTYQRGTAPAVVAPAATPAGTGLYRPNAPNSAPAMPPSPHKRYLPPTKEPGVWAGDAKASATDGNGVTIHLFIADTPFDVLAVSEEDVSAKVARSCAQSLNERFGSDQAIYAGVTGLTPRERVCIIASTYLACVTGLQAKAIEERGISTTDDGSATMYGVNVARGVAMNMEEVACMGVSVSDVGARARDRWHRAPSANQRRLN